ncbi:hypothetical protein WA158_001302 [Blastocystis sp. Blastoise]
MFPQYSPQNNPMNPGIGLYGDDSDVSEQQLIEIYAAKLKKYQNAIEQLKKENSNLSQRYTSILLILYNNLITLFFLELFVFFNISFYLLETSRENENRFKTDNDLLRQKLSQVDIMKSNYEDRIKQLQISNNSSLDSLHSQVSLLQKEINKQININKQKDIDFNKQVDMKVQDQMQTYQLQYKKVIDQLREKELQINSLTKENNKYTFELNSIKDEKEKYIQQYNQINDSNKLLQTKYQQIQQQFDSLRSQLLSANQNAERYKSQYDTIHDEYEQKRLAIQRDYESRLNKMNGEFENYKENVERAYRELQNKLKEYENRERVHKSKIRLHLDELQKQDDELLRGIPQSTTTEYPAFASTFPLNSIGVNRYPL